MSVNYITFIIFQIDLPLILYDCMFEDIDWQVDQS